MTSSATKSTPARSAFTDNIVNGMNPTKSYEAATGVSSRTASVQGHRWMKMPEIQKQIQMKSQRMLLKAGTLAVYKLLAGLTRINPEKMTATDVKLIGMGLTMSGVLDKKVEISVTDQQTLDPEVEAALKVLGQQAITAVQELEKDVDGTYKVIDDPELSAAPG